MSLNPHPTRPCILLVDDTPANIDILVGLLKADYDLKVANRGAKALKLCEAADRIDLVLLDVMMPEMDGYEVCQRLRAAPATHDVPIIFLTAKTEVDDVVRGFALGGNDYVTKPFRPPELLARVRTQLTIRAQQLEIAKKNTELKEMLHIVCHDVANQFAVASLALEIVVKHPDKDINRYIPRVAAAVKNGIGLTNLVREMRRAEDKAIALKPVPLRPALAEAVMLMEDRSQAKQLTVRLEASEVSVAAEPSSLINSVFGNVLSNAIKFSQPGGQIDITTRLEGDTVCVGIRDHGIGMPPEVLENLFDVMRSASRTGTAGERGTGFGMPLMRKFVTQFGGSVEVVTRDVASSPQDHGTEFRISLRVVDEKAAAG